MHRTIDRVSRRPCPCSADSLGWSPRPLDPPPSLQPAAYAALDISAEPLGAAPLPVGLAPAPVALARAAGHRQLARSCRRAELLAALTPA